MRKFLKGLILGLALLVGLGMATTVSAANIHYEINVYSNEGFVTAAGGYTSQITGITYQVLDAGTDTESTIYSDSAGTSMTNPVTTTVFDADGKIDFYIDSASTSVDLIVVDTDGGFTATLDGATTSTRTLIIDERPNIMHHGMIWWKMTTGSIEQDTGIDFNKYTLVHNVMLEVVTVASSDEKIDIGVGAGGTGEDTDGFFDNNGLATAGWYNLKEVDDAAMGLSSGANTFQYCDSVLGALLGTQVAGTTSDNGIRITWDYYVATEALNDLCYVFPLLGGSTGDGYIHFLFTPMRPK